MHDAWVARTAGWAAAGSCGVRAIGLAVFWAISLPEAQATNALYVPAYNALADSLNKRAPYCPGVNALGGKQPLESVTQADLERLRQYVRSMMATNFLVAPEHYNLSVSSEETFPRGLRYSGGAMVKPSLMEGIGDGQGRFTKIPAEFTRSGQAVYAESFDDAPVLWIHFVELQQAISRLRYMPLSGAGTVWTANGEANEHYAAAVGLTPEEAMATCAVSYAETPPVANNLAPGALTTLTWGSRWQAATVRRYAYFQLTGLSTSIAHSAWFYITGNRAAPAEHFQAAYDDNGTSCPEGLWRLWCMVDGGLNEVMRSTAFGGGGRMPAWCSVPAAWPDVHWQGYGGNAVAVMEWRFPDQQLVRPAVGDPEDDGLADFGCGCSSCPIETAAVWDGLQPQARVVIPLGVSDGLLNGGLRVKTYLTEYDINGCAQQMFSVGSSVIWTVGADGDDWQFLCVRRPSGAEVTFSTKGAMAGRPVDLARKYRIEKNGTLVKLRFPGGTREIAHEFVDNALMAVSAKMGRKELRAEVSGGNWPGMSGVAEFVGVWRMKQVNSSLLEAQMGYVNDLVRSVEYRYRGNGPTNRVVYYQGSKGFRALDANGQATWDMRVVTVASNATELWSGITTNTGLRVGLKQKRRTWVDGETGLRMLQQTDVADDGTLMATSNTTLSAIETFPWGEEEVYRSAGVDAGVARTTRYDYYVDEADSNNYTQLRQVEESDGSWSLYEYDALGREKRVDAGFQNAAVGDTNAGRSTEYFYAGDPVLTPLNVPAVDCAETNDGCARLVVEKLTGIEIARTYHSYQAGREVTVLCVRRGAAYDDPSNLVTTTTFATSGNFKGRPLTIERPDGGLSVFSYSYDAGRKELTATEYSGTGTGGVVTNGLRTVTVTDVAQRTLRVSTVDISSGIEWSGMENTLDGMGRVVCASNRVDGTCTRYQQGCCGPEVVREPDGVSSTNVYDELKRLYASERLGVTTFSAYDSQGHTVETRWSAAGQADIVTGTTYDEAGRLVRMVNERGNPTVLSYGTNACGEQVVTTVYPDGSSVVETAYLDGQPKAVTGTAVRAVCYDYGVDERGTYTTVYDGADTNATQWVRTYSDLLGRKSCVLYPDGHCSETFYDAAGRAVRETDGLTTRLTAYDGKGQAFRAAVDMEGDGTVGLAGPDRVSESETGYAMFQGKASRWIESRSYAITGSNTARVTGLRWQSADGVAVWDIAYGRTGRVELVRQPETASRTETSIRTDGRRTVSCYTNRLLKSIRQESPDGQFVSGQTFAHDVFGRLALCEETGPGGAVIQSRYGCDAGGLVTNEAVVADGQTRTTMHEYDAMGRRMRTVLPDGGAVTFEYEPTGELRSQAGTRTYPVRYEYDARGRLNALATFRGATNATPDVTRWGYDPQRGWLTTKVYADGSTNRYTYRPDGLLSSRVSARGVETVYAYDAGGSLTNTAYSDGTPGVAVGLDRLGRAVGICDATGSRTNVYADDGQVQREILPGSIGEIEYEYDGLGRRTNLVARAANGSAAYQVGYHYDEAGRLFSVGSGDHVTRYAHGADGRTVTGQVTAVAGEDRLRGTRRYDALGRLERVEWANGETTVSSCAYGYDAADQRSRCTALDGSYWTYAYDALGQVIAGRKSAADDTSITNYHYEYNYDLIGNRNSAIDGAGRRTLYSVNALNQYTNIGLPQLVREVTWSGTVFTFDGGTGGRQSTQAATKQIVCRYDPDGNLVDDGEWAYVWDGENWLVLVSNLQSRITFSYDYLSRRVGKTVWSNSSFILQQSSFLYDGWNLVSECRVSGVSTQIAWYVWGLDLSDSLQGAGGIGGLLSSSSGGTTSVSSVFYTCDGNGNVTDLVDTNGVAAAHYEYDPFGNVIAKTGVDPVNNPFGFSTKYVDQETGLSYYGYRYYSPTMGRWISRDPIGEAGGENVYGFVGNDAIGAVDALGLYLVAFDGTGNNMDKETPDTNVERLYRSYRDQKNYYPGVGSRWWSTALGGLTGLGGDARIENAWGDLVAHYRNMSDAQVEADPVDIIGFSRGAALARHFANVIHQRGDPRQYRAEVRGVDAKGHWQTVKGENIEGCPLKIRFLGLFDTVASFGKPGNATDIGYDFSIPPNVQQVRHAVARDETRKLFPLIRIRGGGGREERVFPGVHSDVGGGYSDNVDIQFGPLLWIWQEGQSMGVPWNKPREIEGWAPVSGWLNGHESNVTPVEFRFGMVPVGMADHPAMQWRPSAPSDQPGGRDWWYK